MRFSFVYIVGSLALAGSTLDAWAWLTYIALVLVAIGTGGIKPCVSAFGADQFSGEYARLVPKERLVKEVSRFFGVFYFSINTGSVLSFILSPIFRTEVGYWLAFGMPAVFLCIATFVFWSARNSYLKFPATGSVITPMIRVFREGWKHREEARLQPGRTWLDTAVGHNGVQPADVVNAKGFWRILPFYAVMPAFWMLFDQQSPHKHSTTTAQRYSVPCVYSVTERCWPLLFLCIDRTPGCCRVSGCTCTACSRSR